MHTDKPTLIDVSHVVEHGMITYRGLPAPVICDYLSRAASKAHYAEGTTFTMTAAVLTVAPGADNMLVIRNVLRGGRRDGMVTAFGICAGLFVHATLSACGVSMLLMHSATAFQLLKLAGAGYLVWLGVQPLRSAVRLPSPPDRVEDVAPTRGIAPQQCLLEGLLSNVLNPKAAVFYLALLPQFIGLTEPVLTKSLLLASIHYVEAILWFALLSIMLDHMRRFILKSAVRRWLDGLCGTMLVGFGARLALERQ
jgi:RhtB (resistance to homoserine/threonine) family protein